MGLPLGEDMLLGGGIPTESLLRESYIELSLHDHQQTLAIRSQVVKIVLALIRGQLAELVMKRQHVRLEPRVTLWQINHALPRDSAL